MMGAKVGRGPGGQLTEQGTKSWMEHNHDISACTAVDRNPWIKHSQMVLGSYSIQIASLYSWTLGQCQSAHRPHNRIGLLTHGTLIFRFRTRLFTRSFSTIPFEPPHRVISACNPLRKVPNKTWCKRRQWGESGIKRKEYRLAVSIVQGGNDPLHDLQWL